MSGGWDIDRQSFALVVHARRVALAGFSVRQAAETWRVPTAIISRAENSRPISGANLLALCHALGADPFDFLLDPATRRRVARGTGGETASADGGNSGEGG